MDRIKKLCSYLSPCKTFADVACDHGYCAEFMLKNNLCESAVISDISEKSLSKAKSLLSDYIKTDKCHAVCCDGLEKIGRETDEVLIAGIGGEEIVKILKNSYIPQTFVFQPMKNSETLREYLFSNNCQIDIDDIFTDGKNYYFVIKGKRFGETQTYNTTQIKYGRDSLKNPVFFEYLKAELSKKKSYLLRKMSEENRISLQEEVFFMEGILNGETE